jgi:hypothetical protein
MYTRVWRQPLAQEHENFGGKGQNLTLGSLLKPTYGMAVPIDWLKHQLSSVVVPA